MEEIIKNISSKDYEKLKLLLSILPGLEQKGIVTLRVFRDEYLNYIKSNLSLSYYKSNNISFNHLIEFLTQKNSKQGLKISIQSLQQKDFESFLTYLQQKVARGYVVYYRNLKAAFNKAKEWGYVKENYFIKVKLPKRQKLAPVYINNDQLPVICDWIKNKVVKDVVLFAFHTGMRLDEIVNLKWKNVDLENQIITVGDEDFITKGRKQRFVPIDEALTSILFLRGGQAQRERKRYSVNVLPFGLAQGFVFSKEDGSKFTGNYFSRRFKAACKAMGLNKAIHFHSLRHSFASNLAQKDVPLYTIKELLGHSSISTTEIYSHLNMETLREAVKKFDTSTSLSTGVRSKTGEEPPLSFGHLPLGKREKTQLKIFRINGGKKQ